MFWLFLSAWLVALLVTAASAMHPTETDPSAAAVGGGVVPRGLFWWALVGSGVVALAVLQAATSAPLRQSGVVVPAAFVALMWLVCCGPVTVRLRRGRVWPRPRVGAPAGAWRAWVAAGLSVPSLAAPQPRTGGPRDSHGGEARRRSRTGQVARFAVAVWLFRKLRKL